MIDAIFNIGLYHYLVLALMLFCIGLFGVITCRNFIKILICVEFMLNAVSINFVAFSAYTDVAMKGLVFSLIIIVLGAAEVAMALAILISVFKFKNVIDSEKIGELKG